MVDKINKVQHSTYTNNSTNAEQNSAFVNTVFSNVSKNISIQDTIDFDNFIQTKKYIIKKVTEESTKALKTSDFELINENLALINESTIGAFLKQYTQKNKTSLLIDIEKNKFSNTQKIKLLNELKTKGKKNDYAKNEFLAKDLLETLNSNNKDNINNSLHKVDAKNILQITQKYLLMAKQKDEIAATDEEKKKLNHIWLKGQNGIKSRAKRTETLFQGVLNNKTLSLEEKNQQLKSLTDKYIKAVENTKIPQNKIDNFKKEIPSIIEKCTSEEASATQNAVELEDAIATIWNNPIY